MPGVILRVRDPEITSQVVDVLQHAGLDADVLPTAVILTAAEARRITDLIIKTCRPRGDDEKAATLDAITLLRRQ